ncbi:DUF4870 domain-containing protein [Stutzerimonas kirkiae]|uniref:DUF4870 domain-containing protein n=1 Tax=Stutzerimonas kirkiae TaxID=2211392 RepID=A0A4Q9R6P7_9GAMM|nr:DUF4870 domain-containing protein [Stutzerimonas kirkiae]TBU94821.1 DUF4870 domain-containing protein [Stutzerimonas kirkiae]TBV01851.1 DUF4870 domain-containing protein [Stutzerimonas kirkiae]TBV07206.1 DUF4870 domain-containing protein [Stutzerimonas kirkiae]TBV11272.1 DUF4870 domain-containing protein [Stutzerimonas kirkiae]
MSEQEHQPLDHQARQWAMLCHFAAALGFVFPFGNLFGPLIVWQIKKDQNPFIDDQGREAMNFQITVAIALAISLLLMLVIVGFILAGIVIIGAVILGVIAGIKANEGQAYRYPFCWRPIKAAGD